MVAEDIDTRDLNTVPTESAELSLPAKNEDIKKKEPQEYPEGFFPCVYIDSLATGDNAKPLEWAPEKSNMSQTEVFSLPALSQDVVIFVSSGGQESYFKALPPGSNEFLSDYNLSSNKVTLGSDRLNILQKIDSTEAEDIRSKGGVVISDTEARLVSEAFKDLSAEKVKIKRDLDKARAAKEAWTKTKRIGESGDYAKTMWANESSPGNMPTHIYEWGSESGKIALTLPPPGEMLTDIVISVPTEGGNVNYKYSLRPAEKGNDGAQMGYLEEVPDKGKSKLRQGEIVVDPQFLRNTFENYGTVTRETLRWQARDEAEAAYQRTADRELAELADQVSLNTGGEKDGNEQQKEVINKLISKVRSL